MPAIRQAPAMVSAAVPAAAAFCPVSAVGTAGNHDFSMTHPEVVSGSHQHRDQGMLQEVVIKISRSIASDAYHEQQGSWSPSHAPVQQHAARGRVVRYRDRP
jgi:hypothetical protein